MTHDVCAFYLFKELNDLSDLQRKIKEVGRNYNVSGTILLAGEGINGTVAAPTSLLSPFIDYLEELIGISQGELKYSWASENPFRRFKVRLKKEIITMKQEQADPNHQVGTYVAPENWNELISDPEVLLIDTRNTYETKVGAFDGAVDPQTESFTEFANYVEQELDPAEHKKIAMYCTGGIRCEKASAYMLAKGFQEVYHLKGGILKYLECVPAEESKWQGECFVFDYRVAVGHGLEEGAHKICYGCRMPLGPEDLKSEAYEPGVSCPHCISSLNSERAQMLRQRHRQLSNHAGIQETS
jgi:UPF0176 protein